MWKWARPYWKHFAFGAVMLLATNVLGYMVPKLIKRAIDSLTTGVDLVMLRDTALTVLVVATVQACVRIASRLSIFNAARDVEADMRQGLFAHVLSWSPERLRAHPLGDLQSRMLNDLTNVRLLFGAALLNVINTAIAYVVALPLMWSESPRLLLIALAPYPIMIAAMTALGRFIFRHGVVAGDKLGQVSNMINEDLGARMYIAASGMQKVQVQRFAAANEAYLDVNMRLVRLRAMGFPLTGALGSLGIALTLFYGGMEVIEGKLTLGALVAFISYVAMLSWPTMMLGFMFALVQRGRASWMRIASLLEEPSWVGGNETIDAQAPELKLSKLVVKRGDTNTLDGIDLHIPFGERLGIVGEVGSGKSTLLGVLSRQLETAPEAYRVGGVCATVLKLEDVRALIGNVPQQPFLFSMSVRDNVALGAPAAADAALLAALDVASVRSEIEQLPDGLATEIGERGVTLSGGQKQRVALARALAADPKILLLDDCFSAVDVATERRIIEALLHTTTKRTMVIATHRLAVLDHVDRIIVLEAGKIVEEGTPAALVAREGSRYRALYERQRLAETVGEAA